MLSTSVAADRLRAEQDIDSLTSRVASAEDRELDALREFFDQASVAMSWLDAAGRIVRTNQAELALLGYERAEYVGQDIAAFHQDKEALQAILARLRAGETVRNHGATLRTKDGSDKHVIIDAGARMIDGAVADMHFLTREITQNLEIERALRTSETLYHSLLGVLPALSVKTMPSGEIEEIDEHYRAYTGLTLEEARDWSAHQIIHPEDQAHAMELWTAALERAEAMQNEMRLRRHDGVYRWFLVQATPVRDEGEILGWVTISIDIDERKRLEAHERYLAETTAKLVSPLGSAGLLSEIARLAIPALADVCAIGLFDHTRRTARVETAGADSREQPYVEAIHLREWLAAPDQPETIGDRISNGITVFVPEFSEAWIHACASDSAQVSAALAIRARSLICVPLMARGETIGMASYATTRSNRRYSEIDLRLLGEVTSRLSITLENMRLYEDVRRTADELARANASKDEFLGLVSHELKTPITTIYGNAEVLRRSGHLVSQLERDSALADICSESQRLRRIIDNLLILARLEGGQEIDSEPLIARHLAAKLIAEHRRSFPNRDLRLEAPERSVPVLASAFGVEHVLRNLLSNAEKFSPPDQPIDIRISYKDAELTIAVLDRGPGVSEDELELIFTPFYRSSHTAIHTDGIGIGLAVCRRLTEAQRGRIWGRPRPGGGSEFGFSVPELSEPE